MTEWRLIRSGYLSGAENMALDEALLESVAQGKSDPVLRFYRWRPATVSIGYGQRGSQVVNLETCEKLRLDLVRRCTGGRAVLHDQEVTYAVIAHEVGPFFPGSILGNYRVIAQVLRDTLVKLGLRATLSSGRGHGSRAGGAEQSACFTAPGQYELVYQGRKLAGCSQKRHQSAFLQHGSLPVDLDLERLYQALDTRGFRTASCGAEILAHRIGWINRWLKPGTTIERVENLMLETFIEHSGATFLESVPTPEEQTRCRKLMDEKYANPGWTLQGLSGAESPIGCG